MENRSRDRLVAFQVEERFSRHGMTNIGKSIRYHSRTTTGFEDSILEKDVGFVESKCYGRDDSCSEFKHILCQRRVRASGRCRTRPNVLRLGTEGIGKSIEETGGYVSCSIVNEDSSALHLSRTMIAPWRIWHIKKKA